MAKIKNSMNMKKYFKWLIFPSIIVSILACNKDGVPGLDWNPNLALPLVKSNFTIKDILKSQNNNNNIKTGSDGFINLTFATNLFSKRAQDLFPITNQTIGFGIKLNPTQISVFNLLPAGQQLPSFTLSQQYPLNLSNGLLVDTIAIKEGKLHLNLQSSFPASMLLKIKMPETRKNGVALNIPINITYGGVLPIIFDSIIDISNYNFALISNGNDHNIAGFEYEITLTKDVNSAQVTDSVGINISLEDFKFKRLYGKFSNFQLTPEADTVALSIFDNAFGQGAITLDNPKLTAIVRNSFGVQINANFTKFEGYNENGNPQNIPITGSGIPNPLPIQSPSIIGQTTVTQFTLDKQNSNIVTVLAKQPRSVIYQINTLTNASNLGFVLDTSLFEVEMVLDLPMSGSINNFVFKDTIDYKFEQAKFLESVLFRTNISNGFPFESNLQVLFADSLNNIIDSLVKGKQDELVIAASSVDITGKVIGSPTFKRSDLIVSKEVVPKLEKVRKLIVQARNSSTNNGLIKIYDYYNLDIQLGIKVKLKL